MPRKRFRNPKRWLVVDVIDAADLLGISPATMYRWLQEGQFPGYRVGVYWRVRIRDIADTLGLTQTEVLGML